MKKLILSVAVFLGACATAGTQVDQTAAAEFQQGVTTYAEVIDQLGNPQVNMMMPDGTRQVSYIFTQSQVRAATFVPVVGLFAGGADADTTTFQFIFDENGILQSQMSGESEITIRNGF